MNKTKKLTCIITGKSIVISGEYLQKKIEEYGTEEILDKMYVCKEVKGFLKRGYKILEIRKLLNVPADEDLPAKDIIDALEAEYQKTAIKVNDISSSVSALTSFTYNKSDEDVEKFINTFIIK